MEQPGSRLTATAAGPAADGGQRQLLELAAERLLAARGGMAGQAGAGGGAASSNYDYVKIKVRLGTQLEHYYILSRFLLSRMLTVITLPQHKAVRIALDVKKHLVDHDRLDITQEELEEVLFALLRQRGYGDEYVRRYQMVTRFFQQKRPLIILVAGSACTGKSSLAQQLASRLNLPNVLQTDVLYELLRASGVGDLPAEPLWRRPLPPGSSLVGEFQRECTTIRRALDGDLCKCIRDGKSIIIEGLHLDPGLFLREFGDPRGEPVLMQPAGSLDLAEPGAASGAAEAAGAADAAAGAADAAAGASKAAGVAEAAAAEVHVAGGADAAAAAASTSPGLSAALGAVEAADCGSSATQAALQQLQGLQLTAKCGGGATAADAAGHGTMPCSAATSAAVRLCGEAAPPAQQGGAGALPSQQDAAAAGVRRSASYGDAVPRLSYTSLHRQQSPWKDAGGTKALLRPRSARVGDLSAVEQRGQAVFMLQSTERDEAAGEGGDGDLGAAAALLPPVPSPRLAACISLPTVMEHVAVQPSEQGGTGGASSSSRGSPLPAPLEEPAVSFTEQEPVAAVPVLQLGGNIDFAEQRQQEQQGPAAGASQHAGGTDNSAQAASALPAPAPQQQQQHVQGQHSQGQPQHSSMAAADAAAAAAAGTGPVFVPICLAVPDEQYEGWLQDWLALQQRAYSSSSALCDGGVSNSSSSIGSRSSSSGGSSGGSSGVSMHEAAARLCALQAHLRRYAPAGVPVVELDVSDMGRALDSMHAYVLQCIALATGEEGCG